MMKKVFRSLLYISNWAEKRNIKNLIYTSNSSLTTFFLSSCMVIRKKNIACTSTTHFLVREMLARV